MKKVLVYIEKEAVQESLGLLGAAELMYSQSFGGEGYRSFGLCTGQKCPETEGVFDSLFCPKDGDIEEWDLSRITGWIEQLQKEYLFDAILIPATVFGRMLAPGLAMRLHTGLVADVTGVRYRNGSMELVRPAFSGRMTAGIICRGPGPVMMSVRPDTFEYGGAKNKKTELIWLSSGASKGSGIRLVEKINKPEQQDIRDADVLVSGGGGVQQRFDELELLARALHGMVSASRRVVDSGTAPRHVQVGQSGKTVSPRLYMALGISGSIQHVVGLKNAGTIITVNRDRHAPICSLSDIVVEGDAGEFIRRMVKRIEEGE
jgi:electron transfer flavoprotein alpha subunit